MKKKKNKCDFCPYRTASGCMMRQDTRYCKNAEMELFRYLSSQRARKGMKK